MPIKRRRNISTNGVERRESLAASSVRELRLKAKNELMKQLRRYEVYAPASARVSRWQRDQWKMYQRLKCEDFVTYGVLKMRENADALEASIVENGLPKPKRKRKVKV